MGCGSSTDAPQASQIASNVNVIIVKKKAVEEEYDIKGDEVLGEGTFATVANCTLKTTGEERAVKIIHKSRVNDVDDFRNELRIMRVLDHPHLMACYEVFETKTQLKFILEKLDGGSLLKRLPYSELNAQQVIIQICKGLAYLHDQKIMHRDLKCENIMFVKDDLSDFTIKLIDFGLSKKFKRGSTLHDFVGTPYTLAPEVMLEDYNEKADMWSLGVITYIMLTNRRPFPALDDSLYDQIDSCEYDIDGPWNSLKLSDNSKEFVKSLLTRDPKARPSAHDALKMPFLTTKHLERTNTNFDSLYSDMVAFSKYSELKKVGLMILAHQSKGLESMKNLRDAFEEIDKESTGVLSVQDFIGILEEHCTEESRDTMREVIADVYKQIDVNKANAISYTEFLASTLASYTALQENQLTQVFENLDRSGTGYITQADLSTVLGKQFSRKEIIKIVSQVDKNGDGKVDYSEFMALFREHIEEAGICQKVSSPNIKKEGIRESRASLFRES
ncbi:hypothetical protein CYMTET_5779 [Cymbomonas tetramitiformis]|uniref:Calmodulin n=1 Tax=Cymbomonas tetramitiformis TaxID=36881 RepID=A0AAE0LJ24_9CHLO|nr:hypothetical protein CYMTET_5779 [Cymbomonas tetramitiformis]|eukprot:gene21343-25649_t